MPEYRRRKVRDGAYFFTFVAEGRRPIFGTAETVDMLRRSVAHVQRAKPFLIRAAVVLPDHIHMIWRLPADDMDYSARIGMMKIAFTRQLARNRQRSPGASKARRHEAGVWQRRFWEHTLKDHDDFLRHVEYIHANPVNHGHVSCPHLWQFSSFHQWVKRGEYAACWGCRCGEKQGALPTFDEIAERVGE